MKKIYAQHSQEVRLMRQIPNQLFSAYLKKISMQLLMLVMINSCRCSHTHTQHKCSPAAPAGPGWKGSMGTHPPSSLEQGELIMHEATQVCCTREEFNSKSVTLFPNYLCKNKSKENVPCDSNATALQLSKTSAFLPWFLKQKLASLAASTTRR